MKVQNLWEQTYRGYKFAAKVTDLATSTTTMMIEDVFILPSSAKPKLEA